MRFSFALMGVELFCFEMEIPSRGIYRVPDEIPSEWELFNSEYIVDMRDELEEEDESNEDQS